MEKKFLLYLFLCAFNIHYTVSHTYHLGDCPNIQPISNFNMQKIMGSWFVIEKTRTSGRCLTYDFKAGKSQDEYMIEQVSVHPILGIASPDNKYHYTGTIRTPQKETPSKMTVTFPLNPVGSASFIVFSTDYDSYAAIFTCQELPFSNRRSVSVLSRNPTLDTETLEKIHSLMNEQGVSPKDLSKIEQKHCPESSGQSVNLNAETGTRSSIEKILREAGEDVNFVTGTVEDFA